VKSGRSCLYPSAEDSKGSATQHDSNDGLNNVSNIHWPGHPKVHELEDIHQFPQSDWGLENFKEAFSADIPVAPRAFTFTPSPLGIIDPLNLDQLSLFSSQTHPRGLRPVDGLFQHPSPSVATIVPHVSRPLQETGNPVLEFYQRYHREKLFYVHYFLFQDYPQFFRNDLLAIGHSFAPLSHAIAAFAALVHSVKEDGHREPAFWYYSLALKKLPELLASPEKLEADILGIVCTVLQLASFDVCALQQNNR